MDFISVRKPDLYLAPAGSKGIGLFCATAIKADELIEACPTIMFDDKQALHVDQTNIYNYYFSLSILSDEQASEINIENKKKAGCIALGLLSLANHSSTPNARIENDIWEKRPTISLKANQDINANQEITISYGKLWFDAVP